MVTRSLLLVNGDRKVLIDTGNGSKWAKKYLDMYNIDFSNYDILSSLKKNGFETDDITDVICTHMHFDHIGGNTFYHNDIIEPTFPNATYWISKDNWALANQPSVKDQGSFISQDWEVLEKNNMIKPILCNDYEGRKLITSKQWNCQLKQNYYQRSELKF